MVDPTRTTIPIAAPGPWGQVSIASGFLARRASGDIGLITAAHVPTNAQPIHTMNWTGWPGSINAFVSVMQPIEMPLFFATSTTRTPLFSFLETGLGKMADMMGMFGPAHGNVIAALREKYEVVDLALPDEWSVGPESVVTAYGYPNLGGGAKWPYQPPSETSGKFFGLAPGPVIMAEMPTEKGFSGGPAFDDGGTFVGMLIGETGGMARILPGHVLSAL